MPARLPETRLLFLRVSGAGRNTQVYVLLEILHNLLVPFDLLVFP